MVLAMSRTVNPATSALSTLVLSSSPKETYQSPLSGHIIRLGNGGAGPSGLLRALAEDYRKIVENASTIEWYQNISPLTLQALHRGKVDIALTYERDQEGLAVAQGWAEKPVLIFNDHFALVGPISNPAGIEAQDTAETAFAKMVALAKHEPTSPLFLSRNDNSATSLKERSIWKSQELDLENQSAPDWYVCDSVFPADALLRADKQGLYTLTDHGTFAMLRSQLQSTRLFVMGGDLLRNPCNALLSFQAGAETRRFHQYLCEDGQEVIAQFGSEVYGKVLYTPANVLDFEREAIDEEVDTSSSRKKTIRTQVESAA
jgi:ABC-type tungstate transport system permease subunit